MSPSLRGPADYSEEPSRLPSLIVNAKEPYNAESAPGELHSFIIPAPAFFVRNHGPVPVLEDAASYRVEITGLLPNPISLSLAQIKSLPKVEIVASLQCAGNRRTEMSKQRTVKGVGWGFGAVGNAVWGGTSLAQVLEKAGIPAGTALTPQGGRHVEFVSVDQCPEEDGGAYRASVPLIHASSPHNSVLLAYEMNGKELARDHGFPLRCIVPGFIGARSVKWVHKITVSPSECDGFFMARDYKMFPPTMDWHNVVWPSRRAIMDYPVQSAITQPLDGTALPAGLAVIRGYALAGGGRAIERVDVSVDGGSTWEEAKHLSAPGDTPSPSPAKTWQWVLWEHTALISPPCEVLVKAVDESSNTQPESWSSIWNLRGVLNNSWHRIRILPKEPSLPRL